MDADFVNYFCNEINMGEFIHTNQKRWACVLDNYKEEDALERCKDVEAILSAEQAVEKLVEEETLHDLQEL